MADAVNYLTAPTATIKFDNVVIGTLANVVITENYNFREVDGVGHMFPRAFLQGSFRGAITARAAYIDPVPIVDSFISSVSTAGFVQKIFSPDSDTSLDGQLTFEKLDEIVGFVTQILTSNKSEYDRGSFILYFDVDVYDQNDKLWMSLGDCVIDSRRTSIDEGQVIIMRDLTMKFRKRVL